MVDVDSKATEDPAWANSYSDIKFTYPAYPEIKENLKKYYNELGKAPKYMAMVGLPDVLPLASKIYFKTRLKVTSSDQEYANVDADPFYEIATGRIVAEDVTYGTLLSSRSLTYNDLIGDPNTWANNVITYGSFESSTNIHKELFKNYNYNVDYERDYKNVDVNKYGFYIHEDHGWALGFEPLTSKMCPPVVITTSGCNMGNIDATYHRGGVHEYKEFNGVKLSKVGSVGFQAFSNFASAFFDDARSVFINSLLDKDSTLGEANLDAINSTLVIVANQHEIDGIMLYGDPALKVYKPKAKPKYSVASVTANNNVITVRAPQTYTVNPLKPNSIFTKKTWSFLYGAPGLSGSPTYDESRFLVATYTTNKPVKTMTQTTKVPSPMGWMKLKGEVNSYYKVHDHGNGTKTFYWLVRFDEFDGVTGKFKQKISSINYTRILFEESINISFKSVG
jgi:hypothetical protein